MEVIELNVVMESLMVFDGRDGGGGLVVVVVVVWVELMVWL